MTAISKNDVIDAWRDAGDVVHDLTHDHSKTTGPGFDTLDAPATVNEVHPEVTLAQGIDGWLFWSSLEASAAVGTATTSVIAKDLHVVGDDPEVFRTFPT